ncbi:hypothetical protein [Nocardioides sp.]
MSDIEARQRMADRLRRAREPHLPPVPRRHRLAARLRRIAQQLEN